MLRDESVSSKHWSDHGSSCMPLSESHRGLGLEHSEPEIVKQVHCTAMSPKDLFSAKYSKRFQEIESLLKSFWFFMGNKLKLVTMLCFLAKVSSRQLESLNERLLILDPQSCHPETQV